MDECEPDRFTVAVLTDMKQRAEERSEPYERWTTDELLDRFSLALQVTMNRLSGLQSTPRSGFNNAPVTVGLSSDFSATSRIDADVTTARPATDDEVLDDPRIVQIRQINGYNDVITSVERNSAECKHLHLSGSLSLFIRYEHTLRVVLRR